MGNTYVMGDVHGAYKALLQCLERSGFDIENDTLIPLGDIVDGWSEVYECVELLLTIKNLIPIRGNHDDWFNVFLQKGKHPIEWMHGGNSTRDSYLHHCGYLTSRTIPDEHVKFFNEQRLYYIDNKGRMFVHGGFNRHYPVVEIKQSQPYEFYWDRSLWSQALSCPEGEKLTTFDNFEEIFIGHTATENWIENGKFHHLKDKSPTMGKRIDYPMHSGGIWNLDTGAGWTGRLTIMNVDTKEFWQSDPVHELYNTEKGRR